MDAMQILVIILASFLAVFLLLAVILTILLIKVTRQIKSVTTTAQTAVEKFSAIATNVTKVTSPALIAKMVMDQVKKARK
jgi:cell division protein FtsB